MNNLSVLERKVQGLLSQPWTDTMKIWQSASRRVFTKPCDADIT